MQQPLSRKSAILKYGLLGLGAAALGFFASRADKRVAYYFRALPNGQKKALHQFSALSDSGFLMQVAGLLLAQALIRQRLQQKSVRELLPDYFIPAALSFSWAVKFGLKYLLSRKRPLVLFVNHDYGLAFMSKEKKKQSFPSGHALMVFTLAHALARFERGAALPAYTVATVFALSRTVLNEHYLSDVVGGALLGLLLPEALHDALLAYTDELGLASGQN